TNAQPLPAISGHLPFAICSLHCAILLERELQIAECKPQISKCRLVVAGNMSARRALRARGLRPLLLSQPLVSPFRLLSSISVRRALFLTVVVPPLQSANSFAFVQV